MITFIKTEEEKGVYAKWRCGRPTPSLLLPLLLLLCHRIKSSLFHGLCISLYPLVFLYVLSTFHTRQPIHSQCHCWEFIIIVQQLYRTYSSQIKSRCRCIEKLSSGGGIHCHPKPIIVRRHHQPISTATSAWRPCV